MLEARVAPETEVVEGDLLRPATIRAALEGVDTVVYLVHSMSSSRQFDEADRDAARAAVTKACAASRSASSNCRLELVECTR